jgi:hypothetical protein
MISPQRVVADACVQLRTWMQQQLGERRGGRKGEPRAGRQAEREKELRWRREDSDW